MGMRVLVADAERLARSRLSSLIRELPDVERVTECAMGEEAIAAIRTECPDLVFLDAELPDLSGFEVLQAVGAERMPLVVFVSALVDHAHKAFDVGALDYLVKPIDEARWRVAFERARRRLEVGATAALTRQFQSLVDRFGRAEQLDRIAVKVDGRILILQAGDIDWLEARDNYVRLHIGNRYHLVRAKISGFEMRLDRRRFVRIHRGALVNVDRILEVRVGSRGDVVLLKSGIQLPVGSTRRAELLQRLGHPTGS